MGLFIQIQIQALCTLNHVNCSIIDIFLQPELVRYWGYDIEEHFVTTDDGYILGMHRIPYGSNGPTNSSTNRPAIFLAHCLVCNSAEFVFGPPSKSLGYILADSGLY